MQQFAGSAIVIVLLSVGMSSPAHAQYEDLWRPGVDKQLTPWTRPNVYGYTFGVDVPAAWFAAGAYAIDDIRPSPLGGSAIRFDFHEDFHELASMPVREDSWMDVASNGLTFNEVRVKSGATLTIEDDADLTFEGDLIVEEGGRLDVEEGAVLRFAPDIQLIVWGRAHLEGATLTEAQAGQGWGGLLFQQPPGSGFQLAASTLVGTTVEHVHNPYGGSLVGHAAVIADDRPLVLAGTTIRESGPGVDGLWASGTAAHVTVTSDGPTPSVIEDNAGHGAVAYSGGALHVYGSRVQLNGGNGVHAGGTGSRAYLWNARVLSNTGVGVAARYDATVTFDKPDLADPEATTTVDFNVGGGLLADEGGSIAAGYYKDPPGDCLTAWDNYVTRHAVDGPAPFDAKSAMGGVLYAQCDYWSDQITDPYDTSPLTLVQDWSSLLKVTPMLLSPPNLRGGPLAARARTPGLARGASTGRGSETHALVAGAHEAAAEGDSTTAFRLLGEAFGAAEAEDERRLAFSSGVRFLQSGQPPEVMAALAAYAEGESAARPWALRALVSAYGAQDRLAEARGAAGTLATDYGEGEHAVWGLAAGVRLALRAGDVSAAGEALSALEASWPEDEQTAAARARYALVTGAAQPEGRASASTSAEAQAGAGVTSGASFVLHPAHPNPSRGVAVVPFELSAPAAVRIAVYDVLGREVALLLDGRVEAGRHEVTLDGARLPSGTYLVRATFEDAGGQRSALVRRVTLLK